MSYTAIAQATEVSVGTARSRVLRLVDSGLRQAAAEFDPYTPLGTMTSPLVSES